MEHLPTLWKQRRGPSRDARVDARRGCTQSLVLVEIEVSEISETATQALDAVAQMLVLGHNRLTHKSRTVDLA